MGKLLTPGHLIGLAFLGLIVFLLIKGVTGGVKAARNVVSRSSTATSASLGLSSMFPRGNQQPTVAPAAKVGLSAADHADDLPQTKFCTECGEKIMRRAEIDLEAASRTLRCAGKIHLQISRHTSIALYCM